MSVVSSLPPPNETERAFVQDPPRGEDGHLKGGAELAVRTGISKGARTVSVSFLVSLPKKNTYVCHAIPPSTHSCRVKATLRLSQWWRWWL